MRIIFYFHGTAAALDSTRYRFPIAVCSTFALFSVPFGLLGVALVTHPVLLSDWQFANQRNWKLPLFNFDESKTWLRLHLLLARCVDRAALLNWHFHHAWCFFIDRQLIQCHRSMAFSCETACELFGEAAQSTDFPGMTTSQWCHCCAAIAPNLWHGLCFDLTSFAQTSTDSWAMSMHTHAHEQLRLDAHLQSG